MDSSEKTSEHDEDLDARVAHVMRAPFGLYRAAQELKGLGFDAIAPLCAMAREEDRRRKRLVLCSAGVIAIGTLARTLIIFLMPRGVRDIYQVGAGVVQLVGILGCVRARWRGWGAAALLGTFHDVRAVGPLLNVLSSHSNPEGVVVLRQALTPLLSAMNASDAVRLDQGHVATLNKLARSCLVRRWAFNSERVAFVLAVFKALEQVGDETSLPAVETVIARCKIREVREAAEACLPYVQTRARTEGRNLLHPAAAPAGELLHPAAAIREVRHEQLLRSSAGQDGGSDDRRG